jgi:ATP-dependent DNA ligase
MNLQQHNIQCLETSINFLYHTHITDPAVAQKRGTAIQEMDAMIQMLGGESVIQKIEATPYSARLRRNSWLKFIQHPMVAFVMGYLLGGALCL